MLNILFVPNAWDDYLYWQKNDKRILKKINLLIKDIQKNRYRGIGQPELLKENLSGYASRRINLEHRMVYKIEKNNIILYQLRFHY